MKVSLKTKMEIKFNGQIYDLNADLDRSFLEYLAGLEKDKPTLQQFLLRNTGVDISPASTSRMAGETKVPESTITYKGKTYNVDDPQEYRAYLENMRRNTKGQVSDIRGGKRADEIVEAPIEPTTDVVEQVPPPVDARAFTPEYQELYDLGSAHNEQIRNYYESKGRKDLAQWAQANPALAAKEILKGSGQFMAQELLEKRRNDVIQGEFSTASNSQVPDFDPDSANLNFDSERSYNSTKFDPKYVDFSRNNTVPKEVFSVMEQLGI